MTPVPSQERTSRWPFPAFALALIRTLRPMSRKTVALSLSLLAQSWALAAEPQQALPPDVARFIERRDLCDHFRGEEPYDAERREFLEKRMRQYCTGTDAQLAALKKKYKNRSRVGTKLNGYEETIEGQ